MDEPEPFLPDMEKLFSILGRITFVWAHIDVSLDFCNFLLYHEHGGKGIDPEMPRTSLKRKRDFFRACVTRLSIGGPDHKDFGLHIADELSALSDDRHWIIHGAVGRPETETTYRFMRSMLAVGPEEPRAITDEELRLFLRRSLILSANLGLFAMCWLREPSADELHEMFGKSGIELPRILPGGELPRDLTD
jgi:hypothetical protein